MQYHYIFSLRLRNTTAVPNRITTKVPKTIDTISVFRMITYLRMEPLNDQISTMKVANLIKLFML